MHPPSASGPQVLVVDDDDAMLRLMVRELRAGFDVVTATSCDEALRIVAERGSLLMAIVTDLNIESGQSGISILAAAKRHGIKGPRILVTGELCDALEIQVADDDLADAAFGKPWPRHALAEVITMLSHRGRDVSM